jgi:hypothetical protein
VRSIPSFSRAAAAWSTRSRDGIVPSARSSFAESNPSFFNISGEISSGEPAKALHG